jgi:hypothetical protein
LQILEMGPFLLNLVGKDAILKNILQQPCCWTRESEL